MREGADTLATAPSNKKGRSNRPSDTSPQGAAWHGRRRKPASRSKRDTPLTALSLTDGRRHCRGGERAPGTRRAHHRCNATVAADHVSIRDGGTTQSTVRADFETPVHPRAPLLLDRA